MKAAIYVTRGLYHADRKLPISGHAQAALKTAELLVGRGHQVTLITTHAAPSYRIPLDPTAASRVQVRTVKQGTKEWPNRSIDLLGSLRSFGELGALLRPSDFDLVHFFGVNRTAYLLGLLKMTGVKVPSLMTMVNYRRPRNFFYRSIESFTFPRIDCFVALTEYTKERLLETVIGHVYLTRPGILGAFSHAHGDPIRMRPNATDLVLFWRDAEFSNGVDVCMNAFERLSGEFPSADFVFAVRPAHRFEEQLRRLSKLYRNIHLLVFPYARGITMPKLLNSASCVVLPFRSLSCNPQLACLETILSGSYLITTPIQSNSELVDDARSVCFVEPSSVEAVYLAVKYVLEHKEEARELAGQARSQAASKWNWPGYEESLMHVYRQFVAAV